MPDPEKEWSPEDEVDMEKLQKEHLIRAGKFLDNIEAEHAASKKRQEEYAANPQTLGAVAYTPPTFAQISTSSKESWEETKRIVPDAPDAVKTMVFQALMSTHGKGPMGFYQ